jgi:hypothetical protein
MRMRETNAGDEELVFTAAGGARVDASNLTSHILKPAAVGPASASVFPCSGSLFRRGRQRSPRG